MLCADESDSEEPIKVRDNVLLKVLIKKKCRKCIWATYTKHRWVRIQYDKLLCLLVSREIYHLSMPVCG